MFSGLHAGLAPQYKRLRTIGFALVVFFLLSAFDLAFTCCTSNQEIVRWRPAIVPMLVVILLLVPALVYQFVWRRLVGLERASAVVRSTPSKEVTLTTWKKDFHKSRPIFFFNVETADHYGCGAANFVMIVPAHASANASTNASGAAEGADGSSVLAQCCEQSWHEKGEVRGAVKAFIDDETGLPVALQTIGALEWVNVTVHPITIQDKENMLKKASAEFQLSAEGK